RPATASAQRWPGAWRRIARRPSACSRASRTSSSGAESPSPRRARAHSPPRAELRARRSASRWSHPPVCAAPRSSRAYERWRWRFREVELAPGWWRGDVGSLVALGEDERPLALVRGKGRYEIVDPEGGARTAVDERTAGMLAPTAYMLYACLGSGPSDGRRLL